MSNPEWLTELEQWTPKIKVGLSIRSPNEEDSVKVKINNNDVEVIVWGGYEMAAGPVYDAIVNVNGKMLGEFQCGWQSAKSAAQSGIHFIKKIFGIPTSEQDNKDFDWVWGLDEMGPEDVMKQYNINIQS